MKTTPRQITYGLLAVIGVVATWYFNLQFMAAHDGFSLWAFIEATHANAAASSIANDITVVAITFLFWSFLEARRLGMKHWWFFLIFTFVIAIAFTFPLFLLYRERVLASSVASE